MDPAAAGQGVPPVEAGEAVEVAVRRAQPVTVLEAKKGQLVALDAATGKLLWSSPGGLGEQAALIVAGDRLLALTDEAELHVLATGDAYQPLSTLTVADAATWAHPALLDGGRLLVKDARKLTAWQLAAPSAPPSRAGRDLPVRRLAEAPRREVGQ